MQGDGQLISTVIAEAGAEDDPTDALARLISASSAGYAAAIVDRSRFAVAAVAEDGLDRDALEDRARESAEDALLQLVRVSL